MIVQALIFALALVFAAGAVFAAELPDQRDHAVPCRPTIACTADFVPPGTFEIESGALYRRLAGNAPQWTVPLLFKLTLLDDLQWQVGTNGYTVLRGKNPANYLDDVVALFRDTRSFSLFVGLTIVPAVFWRPARLH